VSANRPIARVVVVGSAVPLWLCSTTLARALGPIGVKVSAVELKAAQAPSQVYATLPPLEPFHSKLGVEEAPLLRSTAGSFSLGQLIVDGTESRRPSFFHAWGPYGTAIDGVAFFPCWLKAKRHGFAAPLDSFSPAAVGAHYGRMIRPTAEVAALGRTEYAYHVPAFAYARELKSLALTLGVTVYEESGVGVVRSEADGSIERLVLDSGRMVQGDLYVDVTGSAARLIGGAPASDWLSWQTHFNVDRLLMARAPRFTSVPPFSEVRVSRAGWTALYPTQAMTGVAHAYSSGLHSEEEAARLAARVGGSALMDISIQSVSPGIRRQLWSANCVAIGSSACLIPFATSAFMPCNLALCTSCHCSRRVRSMGPSALNTVGRCALCLSACVISRVATMPFRRSLGVFGSRRASMPRRPSYCTRLRPSAPAV